MEDVYVRDLQNSTLEEFLTNNDFFIEEVTDKVIQVNRSGEQPVFITKSDNSIYFSLDLGSISEIGSKELYFKLLDLNTEILPISIGIDTADESDHRLVLVESRECSNLDRNELLSVFDALEIAEDKVESTLAEFIK